MIKHSNRKMRAFTLLEVMVVVVILSILAAMVVPRIMRRPEQAKLVKAQQDVLAIDSALQLYQLDNGNYPTTEQGLQVLVKKAEVGPAPTQWRRGGYLRGLPKDPWGHAYQYKNPGEHGEVDVFSLGPNKLPRHVIGNWYEDDEQTP